MFINLFKSNHQILLSILFVIGAAIWLYSFVNPMPPPIPHETEVLYQRLYGLLIQVHPSIIVALAFSLLFIQSIVLNNLVINNNLLEKNTFLPALVYFVLMSALQPYCTFTPIHLTNLIWLLCINRVLKIYLKEDPYESIFIISMLISISALIYTQALFFLAFLWLCFFVYRIFKWREWIISLLGFAIPFLFFAFYLFWNDNLNFIAKFLNIFYFIPFHLNYKSIEFISSVIFVLFSLFTVVKYQMYYKEKIVMLRKFSGVLVSFYAIGLLSVYSLMQNELNHLMCIFIPVSIFASHLFLKLKRNWIAEILFFVLLIIIIVNRVKF